MSNRMHSAVPAAGSVMRPDQLRATLAEDIDLARLAPGIVVPLSVLATRLRCAMPVLLEALAELEAAGLVRVEGTRCTIAPIDRTALLPALERRYPLERSLVEAAAANRARVDGAEVAAAMGLLLRSAVLGDIEGYMVADKRIWAVYFAAADMPAVTAQMLAIKRDFRRAWCAYNRLRDLKQPAALRQAIADAVLAGDPAAAGRAAERFFAYLRDAY